MRYRLLLAALLLACAPTLDAGATPTLDTRPTE